MSDWELSPNSSYESCVDSEEVTLGEEVPSTSDDSTSEVVRAFNSIPATGDAIAPFAQDLAATWSTAIADALAVAIYQQLLVSFDEAVYAEVGKVKCDHPESAAEANEPASSPESVNIRAAVNNGQPEAEQPEASNPGAEQHDAENPGAVAVEPLPLGAIADVEEDVAQDGAVALDPLLNYVVDPAYGGRWHPGWPRVDELFIPKCWNCLEPGHERGRCTKPRRKICYSCGKPAVTVATCPTCKEKYFFHHGGRGPGNPLQGRDALRQLEADRRHGFAPLRRPLITLSPPESEDEAVDDGNDEN